jgi:hypothetical protein
MPVSVACRSPAIGQGGEGELPAQASSRRCDAFAEELSPDHDVFEATDQLSGAVADLDRMGCSSQQASSMPW